MTTDPTPALDDFLAEYEADDNKWWRLQGGDHLNLFDEAIYRMRAAEGAVRRVRDVAAAWDNEPSLPPAVYNLVEDVRDALDGDRLDSEALR